MALSKKENAFVNEYFLCGLNQTEAYMRLYPNSSYDSARANASRLIAKDSISAEIQRRLDEQKMSSKEVLARLSQIGRADIADFVQVEQPSDLLRPEHRGRTHVIKKFKRNVTITRTKDGGEIEHQYTELELHDPLSALDKMGRHHALFDKAVGESEEKPFVVKVIKGVSTDDL
jgi:phage terminase small subunit